MRKTATLRLVTDETPDALFGSTPKKRPTKHPKFMNEAQAGMLPKAAASHRDRCMIMVAFIHGMRANELVSLRWDQVKLAEGTVQIFRSKHGRDATHYLTGAEIRDLRRLKRETDPPSDFVFVSRL